MTVAGASVMGIDVDEGVAKVKTAIAQYIEENLSERK